MKQSSSTPPPVKRQLPAATAALLQRAADRIRPADPAPDAGREDRASGTSK